MERDKISSWLLVLQGVVIVGLIGYILFKTPVASHEIIKRLDESTLHIKDVIDRIEINSNANMTWRAKTTVQLDEIQASLAEMNKQKQ